jgi:hypothetical protein
MFLKHRTPSAWAWLLFAAISVLAACAHDIPNLLAGMLMAPSWKLIFPVVNVVSLAGLCQYAIGWRSERTTLLWRSFAPAMMLVFTVATAFILVPAANVLTFALDAPLSAVAVVLILAFTLANMSFIAIAVLRLGDYIGPTRRPLGQKPAQLSLNLS